MRHNILTLLVGFIVLTSLILLFKVGLDRMNSAQAAQGDQFAQVQLDVQRREILYRVQPGDTLWSLAERFYGNSRRWTEIADANGIADGGLTSGEVIRIPLGGGQEIPAPVPAATVELPASVDAARFGLDGATLDVALCRPDATDFPSGALCVARTGEDSSVSLCLFDAASSPEAAPAATYEAPRGDALRQMAAEDIDGDGSEELFTIWQSGEDGNLSRIFRLRDGRFELVAETPDDPIALLRLRMSSER